MAGFLIAGFLIVRFSYELPDAASIRSHQLKVPLRVYSADQLLISEFGDERRQPIEYSDIPQTLIDAVLASEDDGFFDHHGIDLTGLIRAALSNFQSGSSGQGASTITMQVARNFFLTRDKTYTRKIKEILLAIRLEQILSKQEILSLYINKIFLGHRAYGFGAAAEVYYGKPLIELSLAETAMLAGLPKAPSTYNPLRNPERAVVRRDYVLGRMKELNWINSDEYDAAITAPVTAEKHSRNTGLNAPHIAEMVRAELIQRLGEQAYWQGLNVYTTIQSVQQEAAAAALRAGLQAYDRRHGFRGPIGKVAMDSLQAVDDNFDQAFENALSIYPRSREQLPALVVSVDDENARVWTSEYGPTAISLATSKWAKRYKTANLVGDTPKSMRDLIKAGDVVYIAPSTKTADSQAADSKQDSATNTDSTKIQWQLSQIPNVSGALISVQPRTGRIISLIGGYDFFLNKYNRAVQSIRQPGSNIKPFIYSAALDKGFSPATLISGAPIVMTDPAHGTVWRPENYSGRFYGPTRMREALAKSMNLVSIRLLRAIGIPFAREYVSRFGIDMDRFSPTLTMALGSGGATPLEVLTAYSTLANGGYYVTPYFIEKITDRDGQIIYQAPQPELCDACYADYLPEPELLVPEDNTTNEDQSDRTPAMETEVVEDVANDTEEDDVNDQTLESYQAPRVMGHANNFIIVDMMREVVRRGTARKAQTLNRQDIAGKTGTTNDYVDAWFSGFNSKVATTVWVGFDEPATMGRGEAGSLAALPIWIDYMKTGFKGIPEDKLETPDYIESGFVNRATGRRTEESDPDAIPEYFVIEELTPEYALQQSLYQDMLADGLLPEDFAGLDSLDNDSETNTNEDIVESIDEFSEFIEQPTVVDPEDKIIEDEEETEGLF